MDFSQNTWQDSVFSYLPSLSKNNFVIFWILLLFTALAIGYGLLINIPATVSATGITTLSNGLLNTASPPESVWGECGIAPQDVGQVMIGQTVRLRIDEYDDPYFGILTARVQSVDSVFIDIDGKQVCRMYCLLDRPFLPTARGILRPVRPGLAFHAQLLTNHRTLWNILFDRRLHSPP